MEYLPDPCNDRPVTDLPPFANKEIKDEILFIKKDDGTEIIDWKIFQEFMSKEGPLSKR